MKKFNFSAGPSTIYEEVMKQTQEEFLNYKGTGYSLIESSHRGQAYMEVHNNTIALVKELLELGDDFEVLLLGGGATLQAAVIAYNFLGEGKFAQYFKTGVWGNAAITSAEKVGKVKIIYDGTESNFTTLPKEEDIVINKDSAYIHLTSNETIGGVQWKQYPDTGDVPLIGDMCSDIFSRVFDAHKFSMIYASAQKNLGPAGVTLLIIRKDFLKTANTDLPPYLSYTLQAEKNSMINTPPVLPIWMVGKVLEHIKSLGGVSAVEALNEEKAKLLYDCIDASDGFYLSPVDKTYRSLMNVVFNLKNTDLENKFIASATENGLDSLKGHRSTGGCRASMYNAMSKEGVLALVDFMKTFQNKHA